MKKEPSELAFLHRTFCSGEVLTNERHLKLVAQYQAGERAITALIRRFADLIREEVRVNRGLPGTTAYERYRRSIGVLRSTAAGYRGKPQSFVTALRANLKKARMQGCPTLNKVEEGIERNEALARIPRQTKATTRRIGEWLAAAQQAHRAFDALTQSFGRLIWNVAKRYGMKRLPDRISAGVDGLHQGCLKFKLRSGYHVSTYVQYWIRAEIIEEVRRRTHAVRLPEHKVEDVTRLAALRFSRESRNEPTDRVSMANALEWTIDRVDEAMENGCTGRMLHFEMTRGSGDMTLYELYGKPFVDPLDHTAENDNLLARIVGNADITKAQLATVQALYGIGDDEPMRLEDLARLGGTSHAAVGQKRDRGLKALRESARSLNINPANYVIP